MRRTSQGSSQTPPAVVGERAAALVPGESFGKTQDARTAASRRLSGLLVAVSQENVDLVRSAYATAYGGADWRVWVGEFLAADCEIEGRSYLTLPSVSTDQRLRAADRSVAAWDNQPAFPGQRWGRSRVRSPAPAFGATPLAYRFLPRAPRRA
jgi:hypothetical protein